MSTVRTDEFRKDAVRLALTSGLTRRQVADDLGVGLSTLNKWVNATGPRWCSDGLEFTCWNGDVIRLAFLIDAHDRETISWRAVANAGISGSDVRDMLLEAVEARFGTFRAPEIIEVLSDNGSAYTAKETRIFARQLGLKPCFTPVASPQSNGMSEAFVKTLKRDYVRVNPLPNAETVLRLIGNWIDDYNENHPHSGLKWKSPREFIRAETETA